MKISKHFSVTIPFSRQSKVNGLARIVHVCDLTITGVAYYFPEEDEEGFDFDIDHVFFEGKDIKPAYEALGMNIKGEPSIYRPVLAHMNYLFADSISGSLNKDAA